MHISEVYLCRQKSTFLTKSGKEYESLVLQDKTGSVDAKIWDPGNPGIGEFEAADYVAVDADVTRFNNNLRRSDPSCFFDSACFFLCRVRRPPSSRFLILRSF